MTADLQPPGGSPTTAAASSAEREFGAHEMFFSTTDAKGIIRSGNEVFVRISGYARSEMVGKPHNLVRHPDMPRIVFKLLWDEITAGRAIAAYVKNRAADGSFYWVMATVMPVDGGYLSIRIKPSSKIFELTKGLYRELRGIELAIEGPDGISRKEGMVASGERLQAALEEAGFDSYGAFMRAAVLAEVSAREGRAEQRQRASAPGQEQSRDGAYDDALASLGHLDRFLSELVLRLDDFVQLNVRLAQKAEFVRGLADEVHLFALNAIVAASKTSGTDGAAIAAVARLLRTYADSSKGLFDALGDSIAEASGTLGAMLFPVAATRLQAEMLQMFMTELASHATIGHDPTDVFTLHACVERQAQLLVAVLTEFDHRLTAVERRVEELRGVLKRMRALSLNGTIEAARVEDGGQFTALFGTVATRISTAAEELDDLARSAAVFSQYSGAAQGIAAAVTAAGAALSRAPGATVQAA